MEYLREVQDVPVMQVDVTEPRTIVFTVNSSNDVESILPHFTYSRKQVINNSKRIETMNSSSAHVLFTDSGATSALLNTLPYA